MRNIAMPFHVVKRLEISKSRELLYRFSAVMLALLSCGLMLLIIGYDPLEVYGTVLDRKSVV